MLHVGLGLRILSSLRDEGNVVGALVDDRRAVYYSTLVWAKENVPWKRLG